MTTDKIFPNKQIKPIEHDWKSLYYSLALRVTRAHEKMVAGNSDGSRSELVTAAEVVRAWQRLMDIQHTIVQFNEIGKSEPDPDKRRLDWLSSESFLSVEIGWDLQERNISILTDGHESITAGGKTLRDAIDEAMKV